MNNTDLQNMKIWYSHISEYKKKENIKMPILKPIKKNELISISAKFPKHLKDEISDYCTLAGIETTQDFLIQASEYVLSKDKDWVKYKKDNNL